MGGGRKGKEDTQNARARAHGHTLDLAIVVKNADILFKIHLVAKRLEIDIAKPNLNLLV